MLQTDSLSRPLHDLRISVTDRCNFRCTYCMPKEVFGRDFHFMPRSELLTFEEIERVVRIAAGLGVEKIRLTGGEPLLRRDLEHLVARLARVEKITDLTLTTNGSLLTRDKVKALRDAGLGRITISLDSLDDETFRRMNDVQSPVSQVLEAIELAVEAGLEPVKVDVVVKKGVNDSGVIDIARYFRGTPVTPRFIEFMDVGNSNGWRMEDVVPTERLIEQISAEWPIEPVSPEYFGEVAERWRYRDGKGELGFVSSVTRPFCGSCTRLRLSAEGMAYTCLFAAAGHDLRGQLRGGRTDEEIAQWLGGVWRLRKDRYSEIRSESTPPLPRVEMSRIGG